MATATELQQLYIAFFGRAADPAGLDYWVSSGISTKSFAAVMFEQPEFKSVNSGLSVETQVNQLYINLFGRTADAAGLLYWTNQINTGQIALASVANDLIFSATNSGAASAADLAALTNKTNTAVSYTAGLLADTAALLAYQPQSTSPWISGANFASAVSFMTTATATNIPTAAQITASVNSVGAAGTQGQTFTLTPLVDIASGTQAANGALSSTFRFTAANDTVNGMTATMAATDTLIDGSTTDNDVLNITATDTTAITAVNIETVNFVATSGTPILNASAISGLKTVNVTGAVASTVDNVSAAATINLAGYTRIATIDNTNYAGTTAAGNADVLNVGVSGTTHGTTVATQSGITLISDNASTLETLNIASTGTAANDFTLDAGNNVTLSTVNVTGSTDATIRVADADITGLTFNAASATGNVTLAIDRTGRGTTATNANLFSGVNDLVLIDSVSPAVGGDGGSVSGLTVGQKITFADDFNESVLAFSSATGTTDTATIVLDNETAATDTDVAQINIQNIETLVITSNGFATSTSTTAQNLIDNLVGDATTITVGGDTSLDLDLNIDAATSGTRTVVVNASTNTAFVNIEAAAGAGATSAITVAYNITGTAGNDTLALNAIGGTLSGGAGNDTLTGSALNDTISTGAGTDTVFATTGTDAVTFGAGVDTIVFGEADVTAVAQVHTYDDVTDTATITMAAGDTLNVVVNGSSYSVAYADSEAATLANLVSTHAATILATHGVTITAADTNKDVVLTGASTGTTFTSSMSINDAGVVAVDVPAVVTAVAGVSVATSITSFTTGTGGDVISFDISEMNAVTGIDDIQDSTNAVAGGDAAVITDYTGAALTMAATSNIIKVGFANTINAASDVLALIDIGNITTVNAISVANGGDAIVTTFYDADAGQMIVGLLSTTDNAAAIDDHTAFEQIAALTMTSTEYTALNASNFAFIE